MPPEAASGPAVAVVTFKGTVGLYVADGVLVLAGAQSNVGSWAGLLPMQALSYPAHLPQHPEEDIQTSFWAAPDTFVSAAGGHVT